MYMLVNCDRVFIYQYRLYARASKFTNARKEGRGMAFSGVQGKHIRPKI